MHVFALVPVLAAVASASAALVGSAGPFTCNDATVAHETFIGQDANVKVQFSHCADAPHVSTQGKVISARQSSVSNVCDAPCQCCSIR